jgi:hypothetical protein
VASKTTPYVLLRQADKFFPLYLEDVIINKKEGFLII